VLDDVTMSARLDGRTGMFDVRARARASGGEPSPRALSLVLEREGREYRTAMEMDGDSLRGRLAVPDVERWWPHTHGEPALYRARVELGATEGCVDLGSIGFRSIALDTSHDGFALRVNDVPIFCRGACWTPLDAVAFSADAEAHRLAFEQVVRGGMNMVRASGTMVYESDSFFDAADGAGVLVWQDLMFANMDYPADDAAFAASVQREVSEQLVRLQGRPSVAVICGNSEGEQQAAMWGASRDRWEPALFHETFAKVSRELLPDVPYWPSSAHGGAFPHQGDRGTTSYYGVGAYQRPLDDARRAEVRFASECLAFANVPDDKTLHDMVGGAGLRVHHPGWKARTPRDLGAGWDFDDVRDHYVARLFGVDPAVLRYSDHGRYLALGRVVTGEVMAQVFGEWRRARSTCSGGLVWFLRDLWAGAGWGVIGADGVPKAAYYYLGRALAPVALHISDEGGNGLFVHAMNDGPAPLDGEIEVTLFRSDVAVGRASGPLVVPARAAAEVPVLSLFEGFMDLNHAYRFGPATADLVVARFRSGSVAPEAFFFPLGLPSTRAKDVGLTTALRVVDQADLELTLTTRSFAQSVAIELAGYRPDQNFFHLAPGGSLSVRLRHLREQPGVKRTTRGSVTCLNAEASLDLVLPT
jgi:beta-mannosidase